VAARAGVLLRSAGQAWCCEEFLYDLQAWCCEEFLYDLQDRLAGGLWPPSAGNTTTSCQATLALLTTSRSGLSCALRFR
jgi:hypothetical protein